MLFFLIIFLLFLFAINMYYLYSEHKDFINCNKSNEYFNYDPVQLADDVNSSSKLIPNYPVSPNPPIQTPINPSHDIIDNDLLIDDNIKEKFETLADYKYSTDTKNIVLNNLHPIIKQYSDCETKIDESMYGHYIDEINENIRKKDLKKLKKYVAVIDLLSKKCDTDYKYDNSGIIDKLIDERLQRIDDTTWTFDNYKKLATKLWAPQHTDIRDNMPAYSYESTQCKSLFNTIFNNCNNNSNDENTMPVTEFGKNRITPSTQINTDFINCKFNNV